MPTSLDSLSTLGQFQQELLKRLAAAIAALGQPSAGPRTAAQQALEAFRDYPALPNDHLREVARNAITDFLLADIGQALDSLRDLEHKLQALAAPALAGAASFVAAAADSAAQPVAMSPLCSSPPPLVPVLPASISQSRANAIIVGANKWANGTVLHYYFFDNPATDASDVEYADHSRQRLPWVGAAAQQSVVRWAFAQWKALGIGLEFKEVANREEAEIRIGFLSTDGSWSYIGTDVLAHGSAERTMNFGWDLTTPYGHTTALHEIGHTLGLPHEHQSPFSGIVWDEPAVYQAFSGPPNNWTPGMIQTNILQPLSPQLVRGSKWDPDSIMEYHFGPGLIKQPDEYYGRGLTPSGKLSPSDISWVRQFYPPLQAATALLELAQSTALNLQNGEQADFRIEPTENRYYDIRTFGKSDVLLVLFEEDAEDGPSYRTADDDSGQERNATLHLKLLRGHKYVLRARLKYREVGPPPALMVW
jgi:hypothetical protein